MAESLTQDRINRLSSIGFKWDMKEGWAIVRWETRFNELVKYKAKHGDCNVPHRQGKLGQWVSHQRVAYLADLLAQDRIDRLNSIGFNWRLKEGCWDTKFQELVRYKAKHGECKVPRSQGPLGTWADRQRTTYGKGKLTQDRIDRLNGIGFDWTPPRGSSKKMVLWEIRFNELVQYKAKHGDFNVPRSQGPLGRWVQQQRESYKKNKLSQGLIDRLNGIVFDWTSPRGNYKKRKPLPSEAYSFEKGGAPILNTKTESRSVGDRARGDGPNLFESEDCGPEPVLSLPGPANTSIGNNHWTESDDEDDEIGALIYDQVMQKRQVPIRRRTRSSMKCK